MELFFLNCQMKGDCMSSQRQRQTVGIKMYFFLMQPVVLKVNKNGRTLAYHFYIQNAVTGYKFILPVLKPVC